MSDRTTLFLGMNPHAIDEAYKLRLSAAGYGPVIPILDGKRADVATIGGATYDLTSPDDRRQFTASLGLDSASARTLEDRLAGAVSGSRDEMARLIDVFRRAERGEIGLERVVLSGHSTGPFVEGEDGDRVDFSFFEDLARIFPGAAGQVQDLMLSACNTGQPVDLPQYRVMFPNLQSVWGYEGRSPLARAANMTSVQHVEAWERVSRGNHPGRVDANAAPVPRQDNEDKNPKKYETPVRTYNIVDKSWAFIKG